MVKQFAVDSNVLISASRQYYPFDLAPAFWRQLVEKGSDKLVIVDRIRDEILRNEDQLSEWLTENLSSFSLSSSKDLEVIAIYSQIITSVKENPQYKESAKLEFADVADSWLCAHALVHSYTIVTEETFSSEIKTRVKIPNVCKEFGIRYINRLQFIREIGIRFE